MKRRNPVAKHNRYRHQVIDDHGKRRRILNEINEKEARNDEREEMRKMPRNETIDQ